MGGSQSTEEEESEQCFYYKPSPTPDNMVSYSQNLKQNMSTHVDNEERLKKIAIYRTHDTGRMMSTGQGGPTYYIFLKSSRNFWTLDRTDKWILMLKGETAKDVINKIGAKEREGNITKIKEADAAGNLGELFDWIENSGEFKAYSGINRWKFVERVFSKFENGNVVEAPWYDKMY